MPDIDLAEKFPDMRPIRSVPTLSTVNGFGATLIGSRDYDEETGTYVKTHCICLLFIPLIALGAYRVADAQGGGWYFLGKVPLSRRARIWNGLLPLLILALVGGGWWTYHIRTPGYLAGRKVAEADGLVAAGQAGKAAGLYREVMEGGTQHATAAHEKLKGLVESPPESLAEAAGVFRVALELQQRNQPLVPDLFGRAARLCERQGEGDPRGAVDLLEMVASLAPRAQDHLKPRRRWLERLVEREPKDVDAASRLAVVCYQQNDIRRCEAVLTPHADRLGKRDGAAILGRIYAHKGKPTQAHALLLPFVEERLPKLRAAEQTARNAAQAVEQRVVAQINDGSAPGFDFVKWNTATKEQRNALFGAYYFKVLVEDRGFRSAQEALARERLVVDASLDLGMLQLQRAQSFANPAARRQELEKAEKTFLAIGGQAGATDEYRLRLGEVRYWLGKHAEGRKQFDELLAKHRRSSDMLLQVSRALRGVGEVSQARELTEEAYKKETDKSKKYQAALVRSLMFRDTDDQITWLERSNPDAVEVQASLSTARGDKADQENKEEEAAGHYRAAIKTYGRMAESAAVLNNCALAHFSLFRVTQDRDDLTHGLDKIDRAIRLAPENSILLQNAARAALENAMRDIIGKALDLKQLKPSSNFALLGYLYRDAASKKQYVEQVLEHPGVLKGRAYLEKLLLLSPKSSYGYAWLVALHGFARDEKALRVVWERMRKAKLDLADSERQTREYYAGTRDEKDARELKASLAREEKIVQATRKKGGATFAAAAGMLVNQTLGGAYLPDVRIDPDAIVKLAEEAHAAAPSASTHSTLISALRFRAHQALIKEERGYADLAARTRRSLGRRLLTYIAGEEGPLRARVLANADVKRIIELKLEAMKAFPGEQGPSTWAILRGSRPREAEQVAEGIRKDKVSEILRDMARLMNPLSATSALDAYWVLRMEGKDKEAVALLKHLAARKIPMPVDAK
jgi:hypothetical protein